MKRFLSLLVVMLLVTPAVAQKEVNVPKDVLEAISYFVGDWTYEAKSDDAVVVRDGKWSAKWAQGKHCLVSDWSSIGPDGRASGHQVCGWDVAKKQTMVFDLSTTGEHTIVHYTIKSPTQWVGKAKGISSGGKAISCDVGTMTKPNEFTWTLTNRMEGGQPQPDLTFTFKRIRK